VKTLQRVAAVAALLALAGLAGAAPTDSLKKGTPELKSVGAMTFGPDGILFVADPTAGALIALDTGDKVAPKSNDRPAVKGLDEKVAALLGTEAKQISFNDVAVNPISGNTYLSVSRGKGADAKPAIVRVDRASKVEDVALKDVPFASVTLPNAGKANAITDLAYIDGKLIVAGLGGEKFVSTLRSIAFPFKEADSGATVEIFHGNHGGLETRAPVQTFTTYDINGETNVVAAYTCTPLVTIPVKELKAGEKINGKTVAELGNRNKPLDMFVYKKGGKDYLLLANSARGVMKIDLSGVDKAESITAKVKSEKAGLSYETVSAFQGVVHLDRFDKDHVCLLTSKDGINLEVAELP